MLTIKGTPALTSIASFCTQKFLAHWVCVPLNPYGQRVKHTNLLAPTTRLKLIPFRSDWREKPAAILVPLFFVLLFKPVKTHLHLGMYLLFQLVIVIIYHNVIYCISILGPCIMYLDIKIYQKQSWPIPLYENALLSEIDKTVIERPQWLQYNY